MKTKDFVITGFIKVKGQRIKSSDGSITGYKQKDGSIIRPVMVLEVEKKDGSYEYLITGHQMRRRGFDPGLGIKASFKD